MRTLLTLTCMASALAVAGLATVAEADGARTSSVARTPLERSVFHDQSSVGAVARPPFTVTRVRCVERRGFCNVTRQTTTKTFVLVELLRVRVRRAAGSRGWSYSGLDDSAVTALGTARSGRTLWLISATTSIE
jgi:hypothetical protein